MFKPKGKKKIPKFMHQHLLGIADGEAGNSTHTSTIQREYLVKWINKAKGLYPEYKKILKPNKNKKENDPDYYLTYNVFKEFFKEEYDSEKIERIFTTNMTMAAFLRYPPLWAYKHIYEIDLNTGQSLKENEKKRIHLVQLLLGGWEVYYKDKTGVKVNYLWLGTPRDNRNDFFVHFNLNLNNQPIIIRGVGYFIKEKLLLKFSNDDLFIQCIIELSSFEELKLEEDIILNAGAISTGFISTTLAHMVFRKRTNENRSRFLSNACHYVNTKGHISPLEKMIVYYLIRHKAQNIRLFDKSILGNLKQRNDQHRLRKGRKGYGLLKKLFNYPINKNYNWYSFSRIDHEPDQIRVFCWQFSFDDNKEKLTVDRYRINCEDTSHYRGEALYQSNYLHIKMLSVIDSTKHKSVVAIIDNNRKNQILSISSTIYPENKVNESENIAVREIFYYLHKGILTKDNYVSLSDGYLTFESFANLNCISDVDKIYLSRRELATLSYPNTSSYLFHHKRLKEASRYKGNYYLFLGTLFKGQQHILVLECSIDSLANMVIMSINKKVTYKGYVEEYLGHLTAHLQSHTKHKITNMMFEKVRDDVTFSGIGLNAHKSDEKIYHHSFLMLHKNHFKDIQVSNFIKLTKNCEIVQIILHIFKYKFKNIESLKNYFA